MCISGAAEHYTHVAGYHSLWNILHKIREHPSGNAIRIQRKLRRSAQLGARPQLFVTAVGLPEANHICTCPNVSKPKEVGQGGGEWKTLKRLPRSFAFFEEFTIYFN